MHSGELKIAPELTEPSALKDEMRDFGRKVSEFGRVTYNARSGAYDLGGRIHAAKVNAEDARQRGSRS